MRAGDQLLYFTVCSQRLMPSDAVVLLLSTDVVMVASMHCRTAPSVNTFKIRLKTFLFDLA